MCVLSTYRVTVTPYFSTPLFFPFTYLPLLVTTCSPLWEAICSQYSQRIPTFFNGIWRYFAVFTKADHWHVTILHSVSLTSILILSSHPLINPQVIVSAPIFRGKSQTHFSFMCLFNLILLILIIKAPDIVKNFELEIFCFKYHSFENLEIRLI